MFSLERKWMSANIAQEHAPNCPRCASPNTKFCYYNNYSLLQPRYFCKGCRRYWTNGGSLRNVPVGGGCRKNRRSAKQRGSSSHNASYLHWTSGNHESDSNSTGKSGNSNSGSSSPSGGLIGSILPDDDQLQNEEINGGGIDVAAVFARFVSQDSSSEDNFFGRNLVDVSNSRYPDDQIYDFPKESNNPATSLPEYDQPLEALENLEMVNNNNNTIDNWMVQVDSNCLWSKADDDLSQLDFTWQLPGEQLQDFGPYSAGVGHQLELPAEHLRDIGNWSCFDLVGIEQSPDIFI